MSLEWTEIPRRVYAALNRDNLVVEAGQTVASVLGRELKGALGYRVPDGKRLRISVSIRATLEER